MRTVHTAPYCTSESHNTCTLCYSVDMKHKRLAAALVVCGALGALTLVAYRFIDHSLVLPWDSHGSLVIAAARVPDSLFDTTIGYGMHTIELRGKDNYTYRIDHGNEVSFSPEASQAKRVFSGKVPTGTYTEFSYTISGPVLARTGATSTAPDPITIPYARITLPIHLTITEGSTSVLLVRFEGSTALRHATSGLTYVPIVHVETRAGARIDESGDGSVTIADGSVTMNAMFGQDAHGTMRMNYRLDQAALLPKQVRSEPAFVPTGASTTTDTSNNAVHTTASTTSVTPPVHSTSTTDATSS